MIIKTKKVVGNVREQFNEMTSIHFLCSSIMRKFYKTGTERTRLISGYTSSLYGLLRVSRGTGMTGFPNTVACCTCSVYWTFKCAPMLFLRDVLVLISWAQFRNNFRQIWICCSRMYSLAPSNLVFLKFYVSMVIPKYPKNNIIRVLWGIWVKNLKLKKQTPEGTTGYIKVQHIQIWRKLAQNSA